jgi:hypothetical protein
VRPAQEAQWPGAYRVPGDPREPSTDVVERPEQPQAPTEHGVSAGDPRGGDERKPARASGLLRRQFRRDEAAERMTDEIDALKRGRVEPAPEPARQLGGRQLRPEPWQVEYVNSATLGQRLEDRRPPAPGAREPVYEHDRLTLAREPIVDRGAIDDELPNLHDNQFGSRRHRSSQKAHAERAIVSGMAQTKKMQDADAISRLADAGEDTLRRLVDLPRRAVVGVMHRVDEQLHEVATKLRSLDPLSSRVSALEKRLDSLERPRKAPARRASTRARHSTASRASKAAAPAESERAEHTAQAVREGEQAL